MPAGGIPTAEQAMEYCHLHDQPVAGLVEYAAARPVQHLVGNRDVTPHRQAMHQVAAWSGRIEPPLTDHPVSETGAQAGIGLDVTIILGRAPFLGIDDMCAIKGRGAVIRLADASPGFSSGATSLVHDRLGQPET